MRDGSLRAAHLTPEAKRELLAKMLRERAGEAGAVSPLSHGQQALWFLYQLAPESPAYNVAVSLRVRSELDGPAVHQAFQGLVDRHAVLRTTFEAAAGEPVQRVHPSMEVPIAEVDASRWSQEELNDRLAEAYRQPFDLERGPVLRVGVFHRSPTDHILLLTVHHIAFDGFSAGLLLDEFFGLYAAASTGSTASLPAPPLQYTDFVRWQADMLEGTEGTQHWAYWERQLADELPVLNLLTDRPRPPMQTYRGASQYFRLTEELAGKLRHFAKGQGATLYMALLAAFQVLLFRYTGQEDILVGTPTAGRSRPEFEKVIGYFINAVVLRADLSGDPTFKEFLGRVRHAVLAALHHADYPFDLVVKRLLPNRDPSRSPIFEVMFNLVKGGQLGEVGGILERRESATPMILEGLELEPITLAQQEGLFDLDLDVVDTGRSLLGTLRYSTDLFEASTIRRIFGHFETLLEGAVADPEQRVSCLPLLTAAERHQLLVEWNATRTEYPRDACIHELFEAQVVRTPDAIAVVFEETTLTYRELNRRANYLAHQLRARGVGPEVLVGICVERSLEMVIGLLGILKAGGAYVPLDPAYPKERLAGMVADARLRVVVTQQRLVAALPEHDAHSVFLDAARPDHRAGIEPACTPWSDPHGGTGFTVVREEEDPEGGVTPDDPAYVIFTSGSTGRPKGVVVPHRALANHTYAVAERYGLQPADRILQFATISFDVAAEEIFPSWLRGTAVVLWPRQEPPSIPEFLEFATRERLTVVNLPSAYWHEWVAEMERDGGPPPPSLRLVVAGSEAVRPEKLAFWRRRVGARVRWLNAYGPTETTITATIYEPDLQREIDETRPVPIGRPLANVQAYVLDRHGNPVPVGVPGELCIGGAGLARGYLNRPDLTAERFIPDPFSPDPAARLYKTGDEVRYRPDGTLEFLGRNDFQVKIRGFRVELGEVEHALTRHPAIKTAVVLPKESAPGHRQLVAYIAHGSESGPTVTELRTYLRGILPYYMVPSAFVLLDDLPLTSNGKVDRKALEEMDRVPAQGEEAYLAPRTPMEVLVADLWREALGIDRISVRNNFFDLGGHSLLAVQVISRLERKIGRRINPREIIYQTLEQFAAVCDELSRYSGQARPKGFVDKLRDALKGAVPGLGPRPANR